MTGVYQFNPKDSIQVTPEAHEYLSQQYLTHPDAAVLFTVRESGCSGFMYHLEELKLDTVNTEEHLWIIEEEKLKFIIEKKHLPMLRGTQVSLKVQGLNANIEFDNPNAVAKCGCGESFAIQKGQSS
jgi:iron-sulfur cluster assembly accessory protein